MRWIWFGDDDWRCDVVNAVVADTAQSNEVHDRALKVTMTAASQDGDCVIQLAHKLYDRGRNTFTHSHQWFCFQNQSKQFWDALILQA